KRRPTPPAHRPLPLPCADGSYRASLLRPERDRRFSRLALSLVGQRDGVAGSFGQGQGDELVGAACWLALDLCDHVPRLESRGPPAGVPRRSRGRPTEPGGQTGPRWFRLAARVTAWWVRPGGRTRRGTPCH